MEFELINKLHKDISEIQHRDKSVSLITIEKKSFYFTVEAANLFNMHSGNKYVHFARGKNERGEPNGYWYFVVNEVNTGFKVTSIPNGGARINSVPCVRLFCQSTNKRVGDSFYLQKTKTVQNDCPVVEILVHKSTKELKINK